MFVADTPKRKRACSRRIRRRTLTVAEPQISSFDGPKLDPYGKNEIEDAHDDIPQRAELVPSALQGHHRQYDLYTGEQIVPNQSNGVTS